MPLRRLQDALSWFRTSSITSTSPPTSFAITIRDAEYSLTRTAISGEFLSPVTSLTISAPSLNAASAALALKVSAETGTVHGIPYSPHSPPKPLNLNILTHPDLLVGALDIPPTSIISAPASTIAAAGLSNLLRRPPHTPREEGFGADVYHTHNLTGCPTPTRRPPIRATPAVIQAHQRREASGSNKFLQSSGDPLRSKPRDLRQLRRRPIEAQALSPHPPNSPNGFHSLPREDYPCIG
jgi:hypothetical protein